MKRSALVVSLCTLLGVLVMSACSGKNTDDDDDADECCPISEAPTCNYQPGGAKSLQGGQCLSVSDGYPSTKSVDAKGCPVWNPGGACGSTSHYDAGLDGAADASRTSDD